MWMSMGQSGRLFKRLACWIRLRDGWMRLQVMGEEEGSCKGRSVRWMKGKKIVKWVRFKVG